MGWIHEKIRGRKSRSPIPLMNCLSMCPGPSFPTKSNNLPISNYKLFLSTIFITCIDFIFYRICVSPGLCSASRPTFQPVPESIRSEAEAFTSRGWPLLGKEVPNMWYSVIICLWHEKRLLFILNAFAFLLLFDTKRISSDLIVNE